jgi:hypothetical protein
LGVQVVAGALSALSVAPAVSIVDKAIVSNASGLEPLVPCLLNGVRTLLKNPVSFFKAPSFMLIWGVYGGTYAVANSVQAICDHRGYDPTYPKFAASSCANVSLSVLKDKAFARMFSTSGEAKPMHPLSYGMFAGRDSLTILASFTLPPKLAKAAKEATGLSDTMCENTAQLVTPCAMQILSTPGHLYGLDLYNRPVVEAGGPSRAAFIRREYVKTCAARMARIFPAFGVGGVVNANVRRLGKQWLLSTSGTPAVSAN